MSKQFVKLAGLCALGAWCTAVGAAEDMGNMTQEEHLKMMKNLPTTTATSEHAHHQHGAGSWMFEYRYMRMNQQDLMNGTAATTADKVLNQGYMMAAESMKMDMHMLMGMYGINDKLSMMLGLNYISNDMDMVNADTTTMPGMTMAGKHSMMEVHGIGDTEVTAMYKYNPHITMSMGVSLPTGSTDEHDHRADGSTSHGHAPYYMQPGSGTLDFKPAATMQFDLGAYNVGAQGSFTYRPGYNATHYNLGNRLDGSTWVKYNAIPHLQLSAGLAGHFLSKVKAESGSHMLEMVSMMPDYDPNNTGSLRIEAVFGVEGVYKNFKAGLEYGLPVYERMRGIQLETRNVIGVALAAMF
ncbi:MAG: hypothetical protein AABY83_07080 [Pseudomonadota bacterium]